MADGLPIDGLRAAIEAWPLASRTAFEAAVVALELGPDRVLAKETRALWHALESELRLRAGRVSLSELSPIRDDAWFSAPNRAVGPGVHDGRIPLHRYITQLACRVLLDGGASVSLRYSGAHEPSTMASAAERWRWLSIHLPPELLLAALAAHGGHLARDRVELVPAILDRMLRQAPVAQQHLHVGAGPSVARLWDALMQETCFPKRLDGEMPLESFEAVLLATGFARRALAEHVEASARGATASFDATLDWLAQDCADWRGRAPRDWRRDAERMLRMLEHPRGPVERRAWITRARRRLPPERARLPHLELLRRCFGLLAAAPDARLERVFTQYVRVYAITYRHLVQDPSSCGLDWFTRHYERISPLTVEALKRKRLTETLRNDGAGLRLDSLEIRTSPQPTWHETGREVRDYAREVARWIAPSRDLALPRIPQEWGITFHLIKSHEERVRGERKQRTGDLGMGGRYGRWYRDGERRVRAVEHLLRRRPEVLAVVRGIDVANVELAIPTWIVGPLLTRLRAASRDVVRDAARRYGLHDLGAIRVIPHVGEDYRRLSEGLRRMDEVHFSGVLGHGGRVGHGLALGENPRRWCARHRVVYQPLEERLFDLLWELTLVERRMVSSSAARIAFVRAEARRLGNALFGGDDTSVDRLVDGYRDLLDPAGVDRRFGYGRADRRPPEPVRLAERWLFDREVFLRGLQPMPVEVTDAEAELLGEAQLAIARRFAEDAITIECNLSSNFLVGGFDTVFEHPILQLQPLHPGGGPRVSVSLNSDDPISFATRLGDEYAYAYYALVRRGDTPDEAIAWLDRVREMGWLSRITAASSLAPAVIERLARDPRRARSVTGRPSAP